MDNSQSNRTLEKLEKIVQLLQTQNELIQKLLQPQEDEITRRSRILQEARRWAEDNKRFNLMDTSPSAPASDSTAEYIIP